MRNALSSGQLKMIYSRIAGRYDKQHSLLTFASDQQGREILVNATVKAGDNVLDAGAGTGSTGLLAAGRTGKEGSVTLFDLSDAMLDEAHRKFQQAKVEARFSFETGDMCELPFDDGAFDVALSAYSLCPLYDPAKGVRELFRVVKPGGMIGIAHSAEPENAFIRWLAARVEAMAWALPTLSMGCRTVNVLPVMQACGGRMILDRMIGFPLWPFRVLVATRS